MGIKCRIRDVYFSCTSYKINDMKYIKNILIKAAKFFRILAGKREKCNKSVTNMWYNYVATKIRRVKDIIFV